MPVSEVPAGRLVYFHNHGYPRPGVYLPGRWNLNRAIVHAHGQTRPEPVSRLASSRCPTEGFYRVREPFFCCEKRCRTFEEGLLVQLGYEGSGNAILFLPELTEQASACARSVSRSPRASCRGRRCRRERRRALTGARVTSSGP